MSNFIRQKSLQIVQKLTLKEGKLSLFPSFFYWHKYCNIYKTEVNF